MGYPALIGAPTSDQAVQLAKDYAACLRQHGRTVHSFPVQRMKDGTFQVILDVCGNYDPALADKCHDKKKSTHTYVDLRKFSPGKVSKIKGARK